MANGEDRMAIFITAYAAVLGGETPPRAGLLPEGVQVFIG